MKGWGTYPFDRETIGPIASWISGKPIKIEAAGPDYPGYSSMTDPALPQANAIAYLFQSHRWGDMYYHLANGAVPISIEDTRGWMRNDVNIRYLMGGRTVRGVSGLAARQVPRHRHAQRGVEVEPPGFPGDSAGKRDRC